MKKLLIGFVLLLALVAVSYLKSTRDSEREAQAYIEGHDLGVRKADLAQTDTDSLTALIDAKAAEIVRLREALTDSVTAHDQRYAQAVDSLGALVEAGQLEIVSLEQRIAASKESARTTPAKPKVVASKPSHESILKHYRLAVAKLPADLSAYEYRVAVAEVKSETATKFNITVARLDDIREANNLDY